MRAGKRLDKWITIDDITFLACQYIVNIRKWKEESDKDEHSPYKLPAESTEDEIPEDLEVTEETWITEVGVSARAAMVSTLKKRGGRL